MKRTLSHAVVAAVQLCACWLQAADDGRRASKTTTVSAAAPASILPPARECNARHAQVTGKGQLYSGMFDCLAKTVRAEGLLGLYKGWLPCWLRIGCVLAALLPLCAHQLRAAQHDA